jgi:hypothetical protein
MQSAPGASKKGTGSVRKKCPFVLLQAWEILHQHYLTKLEAPWNGVFLRTNTLMRNLNESCHLIEIPE